MPQRQHVAACVCDPTLPLFDRLRTTALALRIARCYEAQVKPRGLNGAQQHQSKWHQAHPIVDGTTHAADVKMRHHARIRMRVDVAETCSSSNGAALLHV